MVWVMGRKTATAAVLLINADVIPTIPIRVRNSLFSLFPARRIIFWLTQFIAPVFKSPLLKTNIAPIVIVALLLKPEMPSFTVTKLGLKRPMIINMTIIRIAPVDHDEILFRSPQNT